MPIEARHCKRAILFYLADFAYVNPKVPVLNMGTSELEFTGVLQTEYPFHLAFYLLSSSLVFSLADRGIDRDDEM